jgi:hypothetical protein
VRARSVVRILVLCLICVINAGPAGALNEATHKLINEQAAGQTSAGKPGLDQILKEELGLAKGIEHPIRGREGERTVLEWMGEGGTHEDSPLCRAFRHFHDPLQPWDTAGLRSNNPVVPLRCGFTAYPSSVRWGQNPNQDPGGQWSWQDPRRYFRDALIAPDPDVREQAFADTFRALGQFMHLVVDASVPEHVRNDIHPLEAALRKLHLRGYGNYEHWVSDEQARSGPEFIQKYLSSPVGFDPVILQRPTEDTLAPVPIARLIDTDTYLGTDPNVTKVPAIGIAEFANANFFSEDTGDNRTYPFPRSDTALRESRHLAPNSVRIRRYWRKAENDGIDVNPVLAECILYRLASLDGIAIDPILETCTDEKVWEQVAKNMLPRAVGYARGVLDYFFRGTSDFTIGGSSPNQTLTITNKSNEAMDGTFTLYADNFSDVRNPVAGPLSI